MLQRFAPIMILLTLRIADPAAATGDFNRDLST